PAFQADRPCARAPLRADGRAGRLRATSGPTLPASRPVRLAPLPRWPIQATGSCARARRVETQGLRNFACSQAREPVLATGAQAEKLRSTLLKDSFVRHHNKANRRNREQGAKGITVGPDSAPNRRRTTEISTAPNCLEMHNLRNPAK